MTKFELGIQPLSGRENGGFKGEEVKRQWLNWDSAIVRKGGRRT